jgi:hypothetical protein
MVADRIADVDGPVLEIGLGNGRTYDHIRSILPERNIFVLGRVVQAHPDCTPPPEQLKLGDLADTLPEALDRIDTPASLAHADIGCGDPAVDRVTATLLGHWLPKLVAQGGMILSSDPHPGSRRAGVSAQRRWVR